MKWLWLYALAALALMAAGTVQERFFVQYMIGVGVLTAFAVAVEVLWNWRHPLP